MNGNLGKFCIECAWMDNSGNWRKHCIRKHRGFVPAHFVIKNTEQSVYFRAESHQRYPAKLQSRNSKLSPVKKPRIEAAIIQAEPDLVDRSRIETEPAQSARDIVQGIREDAGKSHGTSEEQVIYEPQIPPAVPDIAPHEEMTFKESTTL